MVFFKCDDISKAEHIARKRDDTYEALLKCRNYVFLLISQFLGAIGDNFFLWIIIGPLGVEYQKGLITEKQLGEANAFYTCLLYAPYILLAPVAGYLSDRFSKTQCLIGANFIKISGALIAMASLHNGRFWSGLGYLIIGIGACFFSPGKYGILPEIVSSKLLVKSNGVIEMFTIIAVLTGFLVGAIVVDKFSLLTAFLVVLGTYSVSLLFARAIDKTPSNPGIKFKNNVGEFLNNLKQLIKSPRIRRILLGAALFWATGSLIKMNFQPWGIEILGLKTNTEVSLFSLWVAIGVMGGSILAGLLHNVGDLRYTRLYAWIMGGFIIFLSFVTKSSPMWMIIMVLIFAGIAGGLFLIPLNASLQWESHPQKRGKTIATLNLFDNLSMVLGGAFVFGVVHIGATPPIVFLLQGILILGIAIFLNFSALKPDNPSKSILN